MLDIAGSQFPQWQFREMTRGEMNLDPIEGQFFAGDDLESVSDVLVREAIQNSLDAGQPGTQVTVRFQLHTFDRAGFGRADDLYCRGLIQHLHVMGPERSCAWDEGLPMECLTIEDFGTRGLEGDFLEGGEREGTEGKNDFFYFWRNIGRSVDGTTIRGRWGLGKTVFQAASRMNSFFGLTVRRSDRRRLLMGQSVLKIHRNNGKRYAPYGYYVSRSASRMAGRPLKA